MIWTMKTTKKQLNQILYIEHFNEVKTLANHLIKFMLKLELILTANIQRPIFKSHKSHKKPLTISRKQYLTEKY